MLTRTTYPWWFALLALATSAFMLLAMRDLDRTSRISAEGARLGLAQLAQREAVRYGQVIEDTYAALGAMAGLTSLADSPAAQCAAFFSRHARRYPQLAELGLFREREASCGTPGTRALPPAADSAQWDAERRLELVPGNGETPSVMLDVPLTGLPGRTRVYALLDETFLQGETLPQATRRFLFPISLAEGTRAEDVLAHLLPWDGSAWASATAKIGQAGGQSVYLALARPVDNTSVSARKRLYAAASMLSLLTAVAIVVLRLQPRPGDRPGLEVSHVRRRVRKASSLARHAGKKLAALFRRDGVPVDPPEATRLRLFRINAELQSKVRQLERRTGELVLLDELSRRLQTCRGLDEVAQIAAGYAASLLPDNAGVVLFFRAGDEAVEARFACSAAEAAPHSPPLDDCSVQCRREGHCRGAEAGRHCIPMTANGKTVGVLQLSPADMENDRMPLGEALAERLALAVSAIKVRESLRAQSLRDPLTGLYNRRFLEETMVMEERRAVRQRAEVGIIILDVDHFKQFNDRWGHDAGDAVLKAVSKLLSAQVRDGDVACRYGGEEFVVVLPRTDLAVTRQRAEELRLAVTRLRLEHQGRGLGAVTISLGVASFPAHGTSWREVLSLADKALYQAKQTGRNRVVSVAAALPTRPRNRAAGAGD